MTVRVDIFDSPKTKNSATSKPHPKVKRRGIVNNKNLSDKIHKHSTVSPDDIAGILTTLSTEMSEALKNGSTVHIERIGFFSLKVSCANNINVKNVRNSDIILKGVKFQADKEFLKLLSDIKFEHDIDETRHSAKLSDDDINNKLIEYFNENKYINRRSFQEVMNFSQNKATRNINRLLSEGKLENVGSHYQPLYTKGKNL